MQQSMQPEQMRYTQVKTHFKQVLKQKCKNTKMTYEKFFRSKDSLTRVFCILKRVNPTIEVFSKVCSILVERVALYGKDKEENKLEDEDDGEQNDKGNDESDDEKQDEGNDESDDEEQDERNEELQDDEDAYESDEQNKLEDEEEELENENENKEDDAFEVINLKKVDERTYFDFFKDKGVLDLIFDLLQVPEPCSETKILSVCKVLCTKINKDCNTCLDFFLKESDLSIFIEIKNSLSDIKYLEKICIILSTRVYNDHSYLEYFKEIHILDRLVELGESLNSSHIKNLEKTCKLFNQKIPGKNQTFLQEFDPVLDKSLILDILETPDSTGFSRIKKLFEILCINLNDKGTIYMNFFPKSHPEFQFIQYPDKFEAVCQALSMKVEHKEMTFFEYLKNRDILSWIIENAKFDLINSDIDIRKICETLNSKTNHGEQTHLEILENAEIWKWITTAKSSICYGLAKIESFIKVLCEKLDYSDQRYADFFVSKINCFQFTEMLIPSSDFKSVGKLCRLLSSTVFLGGKPFLKLLVDSNMYNGVFVPPTLVNFEDLKYLFEIMKAKICDRDSNYVVFFENDFFKSTSIDEISVIEYYCELLSKKIANKDKNMFEFFLEHSCVNVWNWLRVHMLSDDLEEVCNFLTMNTSSCTDETYLELFKEQKTNKYIFKLFKIFKISNLEAVCRVLGNPINDKEYRSCLDFIVSKEAWSFIFDCFKALKCLKMEDFFRLLTLMVSKFGPRGQYGFDFLKESNLTTLYARTNSPFTVDDLSTLCRALNLPIKNKPETRFDFFQANTLWIQICGILRLLGQPALSKLVTLCNLLDNTICINMNSIVNTSNMVLETSQTYFDFFATKPPLWIKNLVNWFLMYGTENLQTICELLVYPTFQRNQTCLDFLESIAARHWFFDFLECAETSTLLNFIDIFKLLISKLDGKKENYLNFFQTKSGSLIFKEMASELRKPDEFKNVCDVMSKCIPNGEQSYLEFFEAHGLLHWVLRNIVPSNEKDLDQLCESLYEKVVDREI